MRVGSSKSSSRNDDETAKNTGPEINSATIAFMETCGVCPERPENCRILAETLGNIGEEIITIAQIIVFGCLGKRERDDPLELFIRKERRTADRFELENRFIIRIHDDAIKRLHSEEERMPE